MIFYGIDALIITPIAIHFFNAIEIGFLASRGYNLLGLSYFYLSFPIYSIIAKEGITIVEKASKRFIKQEKLIYLPLIIGTIFWGILMTWTIILNLLVIGF
jgi:hypothetical protein